MLQAYPLNIMSSRLVPNIVCDGNSITAGGNATSSEKKWTSLLAGSPLLVSRNVAVANKGISGQDAEAMLSNHSDIDALWVDGMKNILIAWEITNSIQHGDTPSEAIDALGDYCAAVQAVHQWDIFVANALPRYQSVAGEALNQSSVDNINNLIVSANAILRNKYKQFSQHHIDMRFSGSAFNFSDYTAMSFINSGVYSFGDAPLWVHPNDTGHALIRRIIAHALRIAA